jgi:hypothetical protein
MILLRCRLFLKKSYNAGYIKNLHAMGSLYIIISRTLPALLNNLVSIARKSVFYFG